MVQIVETVHAYQLADQYQLAKWSVDVTFMVLIDQNHEYLISLDVCLMFICVSSIALKCDTMI